MADETSTTDTTVTDDTAATADQSADLGDAGKKALAEERKAKREAEKRAAELESRLKAFEDRDKTEAERLAERAAAAEQQAQQREQELARYKVAATTGVPADLLSGADEDAISDHAARLIAWRDASAPQTPTDPRPRGDVGQGVRGRTPGLNEDDPLLADLKQTLGIR
jgi:ABC-type transporter Mla subunit MlaD